jgi:phosphatidylserine decarboxylase
MTLTKYGRREWMLCSLAAAAISAIGIYFAFRASALFWIPVCLAAIFGGWVLWFFRDPTRPIPGDPGLFVSPADGTVTDITPLGPESALGRPGVQIGVFMSVFSVHVNRVPCEGVVKSIQHQEGRFLDARDPSASEKNESATITLAYTHKGQTYPVVFRQIAGLIARRIVTDLQVGQSVQRGEKMGMIKFGSRGELLLPVELAGEIRVQVGQYVHAGSTVLAATEK